jgi:hypothetical protein
MEAVKQSVQNINVPQLDTSALQENLGSAAQTVGETLTNIKDSIGASLNKFSSPESVSATTDYLSANSIIAKIVFILFIIIMFVVLLNLGVAMIIYFTTKSNTPYIIKGLLTYGNSNKVIVQDPKKSDSVRVSRSNNAESGLECTWSIWIYIYDIDVSNNVKYSHVFNKGSVDWDGSGVAITNNAPGLYVSNTGSGETDLHSIRVYMDSVANSGITNSSGRTYVDVSGIPLRKWVNVCIRMKNTVMDIYVNGIVSGRTVFQNVPKQNYDNINIGHNGGFNGQLSDFIYYNYALSIFEMNNIILKGPNLIVYEDSGNAGSSNYISNSWYFQKYM